MWWKGLYTREWGDLWCHQLMEQSPAGTKPLSATLYTYNWLVKWPRLSKDQLSRLCQRWYHMGHSSHPSCSLGIRLCSAATFWHFTHYPGRPLLDSYQRTAGEQRWVQQEQLDLGLSIICWPHSNAISMPQNNCFGADFHRNRRSAFLKADLRSMALWAPGC